MVCTWQNWDNIIDYVKSNLGASTKNFEFTDDEIMQKIKMHSLPLFSRYSPLIRYYALREEDAIQTRPTWIYQFVDFDYSIIKINKLINRDTLSDLYQTYNYAQSAGDITDFLMRTNMEHMARTSLAPNTWRFFAPDKVEVMFSPESHVLAKDFIAELACVHKDPTEVNPDMYQHLLDLALADIMIFIGRMRTKFRQFSTPYGQVDLNADDILQEGKQLKQEVLQNLKEIPPEDMIFWIN